MSSASARESYRAGKRSRPSDSQANHRAPPVLFRLPSIAIAGHDSTVGASNVNSAAVANVERQSAAVSGAMPMAAALPISPSHSQTTSTSTHAQAAATARSTEKAAGQRLLNMLIVVLLLAALAVITWISLNPSSAPPSLAGKEVGNNEVLDSLGDLKVPDVQQGTLTSVPVTKPESTDSGLSLDEIKPSQPSDLAMIDHPDGQGQATAKANTESLMIGLEPSANDSSLAIKSDDAKSSTNTTAQIQLRTPVPMGGNQVTSLVEAQKPSSSTLLSSSSPGSSTSPRVDTVSTPTQPAKVFPANTDATRSANSTSSTTSSSTSATGNSKSGDSPALWDGAQKSSLEGLQLSQHTSGPSSNGGSTTQVNISKPLSMEIPVPGSSSSNTSTTPSNSVDNSAQIASQSKTNEVTPGVTVGGGEKQPYSLQGSRPDLDPVMLARVAAQGLAKSAVSSNSGTVAPKINSYVGASTPTPNQNLYQNNYVKPSPTNAAPVNSYANSLVNVPAGVTGNGPGAYVPPTTAMANASQVPNQFSNQVPGQVPGQFASGPTSLPASTAGYSLPPRAGNQPGAQPSAYQQPTQPNYQQPNYQQPSYQPNYQQPTNQQPNYSQPGSQQPSSQQPNYQPSNYQQPSFPQPGYPQSTYQQSTYQQPSAQQTGYAQQGAYGAPSGSGYGNTTYPTAGGMQTSNMPANPATTSFPTKSLYPSGQTPGLIGGSGNATPPTGDVAPIPVMGRGGVGTATPYGSPQ